MLLVVLLLLVVVLRGVLRQGVTDTQDLGRGMGLPLVARCLRGMDPGGRDGRGRPGRAGRCGATNLRDKMGS